SGNSGSSEDAPLEFDFDIRIPEPEEATVTDSDRTIADPASSAQPFDPSELSLVPLPGEEPPVAEKTRLMDAPAKGDEKTQLMPPPDSGAGATEEKTQVVPRGAEKTQVVNRDA